MTQTVVLLTLLALYTGVMIHHARVGNRRTKGSVDYYIGGRSLGGGVLGLSFFATYASTNSFVGFAGKSYSHGASWMLIVIFAVVFSILAWTVVAPRLRRFTEALDAVTIPDFIGFRFGSTKARVLAACLVIFSSFLYMTAVYKGIGTLLQTLLGIPYAVAIGLVVVLVVVYTAVGGFHSVVRTDGVQGLLMIVAGVILTIGTIRAAGGLGAWGDVQTQEPELFTWSTAVPLPILLGILFASTVKLIVEPRQLSRFYALDSEKEARKGFWVSTLCFAFVFLCLAPIGIFAHEALATPLADTDLVVPTLIAQEGAFHPVLRAFLFLALISAAMSSLDSVLLVMASTAHRDLIAVARPQSDTQTLRGTRIAIGVFALITAGIALNPPGGIVELTAFSGSLYAACFLPAIVLGLWWRKGGARAALGSLVVGFVVLTAWRYLGAASGVHEVFPAMLASVGVYGVLGRGEEVSEDVGRLF